MTLPNTLANTLPKTLLEMAGATPAPIEAADTALVMIDCQNEYLDGALALPGAAPALAEGARLLAFARDRGLAIVHVRHKGRPGGLFDPNAAAFAISEAVAPAPGEPVVDKGLPNAFAGTDLDDRLKRGGCSHLLVAGFMTHMCVSSTVRAALDLGYRSTVLAAACATRELPDGDGGRLGADQLHRAELAALADRFATIAPDVAALG